MGAASSAACCSSDSACGERISVVDVACADPGAAALTRVEALRARSSGILAKQLTATVPSTLRSNIGRVSEDKLNTPYDIVVIGGGPAGVAAGLKAAYMGRRALLIDKPKLPPTASGLDVSFGGPTGLFSKALRDVSKSLSMEMKTRSNGQDAEKVWEQVLDGCHRMASTNALHQVENLKQFKVDYLQAEGHITSQLLGDDGGCDKRKILARTEDGQEHLVSTENVLIATGSKPRRPRDIPFDDNRIFDSDTINSCKFLPTSVAIIGSGIIAIEYAAIFRKLGAEVFVLVRSGAKEALKRIGLDPDISSVLLDVLRQDSVHIFEQTSVTAWKVPATRQDLIELKLSSSEGFIDRINVDLVLAAIGREPHVANLGLETLGVELERGHVKVDAHFATNIPGIFAAGDVVGPPALAATGVHQAQGAVLAMFDEGTVEQNVSFSVGMWTMPECGFYGLTKDAAERDGLVVEEGLAPYSACLRGRVFAPDGLLKLVFTKDAGIIVGIHIVGADACELVHYGMELVKQRVKIFDVMSQIFSAVTYHELFQAAAINGNSKLEFGLEWQEILKSLGIGNADIAKEQLRQEFDKVDTSGDGHIDAAELKAVFQNVGREVKLSTITNLMRLADENNSGTLDWGEFEQLFDKIKASGFGK